MRQKYFFQNKKLKIKMFRAVKIISITLVLFLGSFCIGFSAWLYPKVFHTEAVMQKNREILPGQTIYVEFDYPVLAKSYQGEMKIIPQVPADFFWEQDNKRLAVTPRNFWNPELSYSIELPKGRSVALTKISSANLQFSTIKYPGVASFIPENEAKDVVLDIEDPIVVNFDKSTKDFFIKFSVDPESEMGYENNAEKTQFKLIPKEEMNGEERGGKNYTVTIYAKYFKDTDDNFKQIYQSSFSTLPPAPKVWEKDFDLRLNQARKFTKPQILENKYIDINLSTQIMSMFENGKLLDSYLLSTGKKGMETPKGAFSIQNKHPRAWSKTYGLYMPYWMAIVPGGKFGIHELPEWPGGYKEGANHLGTPVSHGCVRLGVGPAKIVYEWAEVGTPVVIY